MTVNSNQGLLSTFFFLSLEKTRMLISERFLGAEDFPCKIRQCVVLPQMIQPRSRKALSSGVKPQISSSNSFRVDARSEALPRDNCNHPVSLARTTVSFTVQIDINRVAEIAGELLALLLG